MAARGFRHETRQLILARILIEQERGNEAEQLISTILTEATRRKDLYHQVWCLILRALIHREIPEMAGPSFSQALALGTDAGFFQLFLSHGQVMLASLNNWLEKPGADVRADTRLLAKKLKGILDSRARCHSGAPKPVLSERELEVVELIAAGMSNKDIASALSRSPATVKTHLHNIFSKLNVHSRTAAIARLRELGMVQ